VRHDSSGVRWILACILSLTLTSCRDDPAPVSPSPEASATLEPWGGSGTYTVRITRPEVRSDPRISSAFPGRWELSLEDDTHRLENELVRVTGDFTVADGRLIFDAPPAPEGAFNCYVDGERTLEEGTGTYSYALEDDELTLEAEDEPCPRRAFLLERVWTRT